MVRELLDALGHALAVSASMGWKMLWALIGGFALSAVVEAVVPTETVSRLLGDDGPRSLATATGTGAASSSCSYAAVALARSLFVKGADFTAAITFEIASTNLVIELGILLTLLLGWRFTLAEAVGGVLMIAGVALAFRLVLHPRMVEGAREQAERGVAGRMEGHAAMDVAVEGEGSWFDRLVGDEGRSAVATAFVMNWASVWTDIVLGLAIAGMAGAWIPRSFWHHLFLADHPLAARAWGPLIGPVVALASFVCSVGNVPLAAVLWNSGISFGGVVSFLFADLIIVPILLIYRKYYGTRMALVLLGVLYAAMVVAGYLIEAFFGVAGLTPSVRDATVFEPSISWNYTTYLNLVLGVLGAALVARFVRDGRWGMLSRMGGDPPSGVGADRRG